jgi:hypothetical protein
LIAGELALLGKMAADSAKKTVTEIASAESSKVVKAISKDLADDATEEAAKDAAAAKVKADAEAAKDPAAAKENADAEKASTPKTATDPNAVTVAEPATVKDSASTKIAEAKDVPSSTLSDPSKPPETNDSKATKDSGDKTVSIEIAAEASKTVTTNSDGKIESSGQPVSLKITIGADGEVKAVSKEVNGDVKDVAKPTPTEAEAITKAVVADSVKPEDAESTTKPVEKKSADLSGELESKSEKKLQETPEIKAETKPEVESETKPEEKVNVISDNAPSVDDQPSNENVKIEVAAAATTKISSKSVIEPSNTETSGSEAPQAPEKIIQESLGKSVEPKAAPEPLDEALRAVDIVTKYVDSQSPSTSTAPPPKVAVANITTVATSKTINTTTTNTPEGFVTISQESLDHLHLSKSPVLN